MVTIRPLNVEIGIINVLANKQVIYSDFKDIQEYTESTDQQTRDLIKGDDNYPSFVTKSKFKFQRDVASIVEPA